MRAFRIFDIPMIGVTEEDFATAGIQFNLGVAPCEIDFLTTIPGLKFSEAWENRVISTEGDFPIHYLGKSDLIRAKQTAAGCRTSPTPPRRRRLIVASGRKSGSLPAGGAARSTLVIAFCLLAFHRCR